MSTPTVDLTGLELLSDELERFPLTGKFGPEELAQLFIDTWIPYMECHKCGRSDYCKYTKPHPHRPGSFAEIQCGVASEIIRNYVSGVFWVLQGRPAEELQAWLDASYWLVQFIYGSEIHVGRMLDKDHLDWWGTDEYRAAFFGWTAQLRKSLDRFASVLNAIPEFRTSSCIVLTEGPSEKAFLERLKRTRLLWFLHLDVESYYGTGNRQPTKLLALARRMGEQGYRLFIQGDADGRATDIFDQLVKQGIVDRDDTFSFTADFESAFTADHLYSALRLIGLVSGVDAADFTRQIDERPGGSSVLTAIQPLIGVEIDKIELAEALADVLDESDAWNDDEFWLTEIGEFLDKIRRLPV